MLDCATTEQVRLTMLQKIRRMGRFRLRQAP